MHFVVLEKIVKDKYHIVDPKIGKEVFDKSEVAEHFTNFVIKQIATDNIVKNKDTSKEDHIYYSFFQVISLRSLS